MSRVVSDLYIYDANPTHMTLFSKVAKKGGWMIYSYCKWKMGMPKFAGGPKPKWVTLDNVAMNKWGFEMDRKTKNIAIRKLEKEGLLEVEYLPGAAPRVHLLV